MEEFYQVATEVRGLAEQEKDPDRREELLEAADEYAELIRLLQVD
jgi:hypothetical protein